MLVVAFIKINYENCPGNYEGVQPRLVHSSRNLEVGYVVDYLPRETPSKSQSFGGYHVSGSN